MRLRLRLLLLIALLLGGVLAGSFAWIFSDLRAQYARDLEASLGAAVASFGAGETQRFRTLEVMAGSLEASPSFRNVLRQTDQATLLDFAQSTAQGLQVDLLVVWDAQGKVRAQTGKVTPSQHPASAELIAWAGGSPALRHYWWQDGALYQGATVPLVDSQDYIDGYVSVAYRFDQAMLERLAKELDCTLELHSSEAQLRSQPADLGKGFLQRLVPLGGKSQSQLVIARSLAPIESVVTTARLKLLTLGSVAFLLALAASYPLVGKVANPLEALQKAQAEMEAIFETSLDGLISFDEVGRIRTANPAAGVALGKEGGSLVGLPLLELLPEPVLRQLTVTPAGIQQQADYERAGRQYRLYRSFVRPRGSVQLGSILLFHDVSEERQRERQVSQFLAHLCQRLEIPESPWRVRVGLATLSAWSSPGQDEGQCHPARLLAETVEAFRPLLPSDRACSWALEAPEDELAALSQSAFKLVLEILLENALLHGAGDVAVSLRREGGTLELEVRDSGPTPPTDLDACLSSPGLGLKVVRALCVQAQGRLEIGASPAAGTRALVVVPRGIK